jgi:hypothetical protein
MADEKKILEDIQRELGLEDKALKAIGRVLKENTEEWEAQLDLADRLVSQFKKINDEQKKGVDNASVMRDFSKRILQDTVARELIYRRMNSDIEDSQKKVIEAKSKEFDIQKKLVRNDAEKSLMAKMQARIDSDFISANNKKLDLAKQLSNIEEEMNDAQLRAIHNEEDLSDEYGKMASKREAILLAQQKNEFDLTSIITRQNKLKAQGEEAIRAQVDQARRMTAMAEAEVKARQSLLKQAALQAGYMAHMEDSQYAMLGPAAKYVNMFKQFSKDISVIPLRFMLLDKLISLGVERFIELDKAAENFRKETGFSVSQMKDLRESVDAISIEFASMGINAEGAYRSAKALTDIFGRTSLVSKEALTNVSLLNANLGVSEEHSANVLATFQGLGGATEQAAMNIIKVGSGISDKAGIPFKLVMQDVANASEETLASLGANPSKLMKSAIAARSMGMELNKLVSSQRKLLDFSNSINDEMEASAMLGRNINFQLARQLAFEGRVEDAARATLETVKNAGDFNAMNVYQREALAKAAGMELKDLTKMMAQDAKREAILKGNDEAKKATLKAQEKELENLKKINDLDSEDLVKQNEKALMQQKIQGLMTKLQNALTSMAVSLGSVLEPIITPLVDVIVPAFQGIAFVIGLIGKGLSWILSPIRWIASGISSIASGTGSWSKTIDFIKAQFKDLGTTIGTLIQIAGAGLITTLFFGMGGAGKVMDLVTKPFKAVGSIAKGLVEKIKSPIASAVSPDSSKMATDAARGTVSAAKSSENIKPSAGEGVKKFLQSLAAGLKSMAKADVFIGAANLIPASIGLVAMIPGFFGAKLLSMVNGDAVSDALKGIASGLKKMASKEVALGAASLMLASLSFAVMTVGAIGLAAVAFLGIPAGIGLEALASGIKALGNGKVLFGIAALGLLALAFGGMAYGFKQFADLEWSSLGKAAVAIIGLSLAAAGLAYIAPLIIGGSIALGILGAAIAIFGLGVKVLAETLPSLATSIEQMLTPLTSLGSMSGDLFAAAGGITAIGIALAAFGGGAAAAGIGNFVGGLLGGDPVKKLEKLASVGTQLQTTADSIERISTAMSNFGAVDAFTSAIDKLTLSLSKLNDTVGEMSTIKLAALSVISATGAAVKQTETAPAPAPMDTVGAKLDELIDLMRSGGIAVNLDGRKVSSAMASSGRE